MYDSEIHTQIPAGATQCMHWAEGLIKEEMWLLMDNFKSNEVGIWI